MTHVENRTVCSGDSNTESEAALVERALQGDGDAFATLFHVHRGRVYAICLRMTNNSADADDLTQEAFIQAFRKLSTFRGESALSTWLHRVAVNTALMHFRRQALAKASLEAPSAPEAGNKERGRQDERLRNSLDRIALTRALEALPSGYRTIFELHEIGGYGHREIAKLLRCSVGNSKSQLHKAKQRIRECLVSRRSLARHMRRTTQREELRNAGGTPLAVLEPAVDVSFGSKQPVEMAAEPSVLLATEHETLAETAVN